MARASVETMLPLDTFARILGINPVHFGGAFVPQIFPSHGACEDVWPQHTWQVLDGLVSREELAWEIHAAEEEVKRYLGYSPFPTWEAEEFHYIDDRHGMPVSMQDIKANFGYMIEPGRRAVSVVDEGATVVYSDPDGDGFTELATITATTALTDVREIKIYFAGNGALPEWEIRPVISKSISGGTVTITVESWKLIDPDLWERYPGATGVSAIDLSVGANLVSTVDVYREYTDHTQASAQFYWTSGDRLSFPFYCSACNSTGCSICGAVSQEGCIGIREQRAGFFVPYAGSYDADNAVWTRTNFVCYGKSSQVKIWYREGYLSKRYLQGLTTDPVDYRMAQIVTWIAASRLSKDICSCTNVRNIVEELKRDMTKSSQQGIFTRFRNMDIFECPFGLHYGEVRAFQALRNFTDVVMDGGGF